MEFPNNFDIDMLRLALEQYFCDSGSFDDDTVKELFLEGYAIVKNKGQSTSWSDLEDNELFSSIWEPFEGVLPYFIVSNVEDMVYSLEETYG